MAKILIKYTTSMGLIFICLLIGNAIQSLLNTSIPSSIIGMLTLFTLLVIGVVPSEWVRPSATLFIRYMVLLFVPVSVGLMEHLDMLYANALPVLASVIGGSFVVLIVLGLMLDRLLKKGNK
ncbi:CidA/LrgA family protein [Vibrio hepatarius]|uniref:CidA/LrgA family protein n=1 Tax=Vibrio hepatarius TaxID=171383 RepID=UPI001C0A0792|nr:CidA/LrgA family protein [Vibrio hepatarius]MBU2897722.1 CidA/LrgA family protein [Vibrio hepatarius]